MPDHRVAAVAALDLVLPDLLIEPHRNRRVSDSVSGTRGIHKGWNDRLGVGFRATSYRYYDSAGERRAERSQDERRAERPATDHDRGAWWPPAQVPPLG